MRILIDGKEFTKEEMNQWKQGRVAKVFRNLKKPAPLAESLDALCDELTERKLCIPYEEMIASLRMKLAIGRIGMKLAAVCSGGRRRAASTTLFASGIGAERFSKMVEALMLEDTEAHRRANIAACPDHYVLLPRKEMLEVIETTGNAPVPTQFFITLEEETGLQEPRDTRYPYQSVGIAKLADGTMIGGVRHQFRDTQEGMEVRTWVEFPAICPKGLIKAHQKHLAAEWSSWIAWAIENQ